MIDPKVRDQMTVVLLQSISGDLLFNENVYLNRIRKHVEAELESPDVEDKGSARKAIEEDLKNWSITNMIRIRANELGAAINRELAAQEESQEEEISPEA